MRPALAKLSQELIKSNSYVDMIQHILAMHVYLISLQKPSIRARGGDVKRPLLTSDCIDDIFQQKERERKRKKLEEKRAKIIPGLGQKQVT